VTTTDKPVTRVTRDKYKFSLSGFHTSDGGRQVVVTLDGPDIYLRCKGSRKCWRVPIAEVLQRLMVRQAPEGEHEADRT
jgi:hypothetical protein